MMKIRVGFLIALFMLLQGCTTLNDAKKARGEGVRKIYLVNSESAWDASVMTLMMLNLEITDHSKSEGYILARRGVSAFSYGEHVAVFLKPITSNDTEIEVVSKRAVKMNLSAPDWSESFHEHIRRNLANK
jgi:hypothetical protein